MSDSSADDLRDCMLLEVMVAMAAADKDFRVTEKDAIVEIYSRLAGRNISAEDVDQAFADQPRSDELLEQLAVSCPHLGQKDKEKIMVGAYLVLLADGVIAAEEKNSLHKIAHALKMPEIHYQTVLERLEGERQGK